MRTAMIPTRRGFTLMETVIAIGVLAVLLTAFMAVFAPATQGIRRSINVQEADRLVATLEKELATLRVGESASDIKTAFDKAFKWIREAGTSDTKTIFVYHYRGNPNSLRTDGTMEPFVSTGVPGKDFIVEPMCRLRDDPMLLDDLKALESRVFAVETVQLLFENGVMSTGKDDANAKKIQAVTYDNSGKATKNEYKTPDSYPEAVIAFAARFYDLPSTSKAYLGPGGTLKWEDLKQSRKPIFTRNLGVRR